MRTTTPLLGAGLVAGALALGVAAPAPAHALGPRQVSVNWADVPSGYCATSRIGYDLDLVGAVQDGGTAYDYFGLLAIDGDGTVLDHDVHRVLAGTTASVSAEANLSGVSTPISDRAVELRLVDLGFAPADGTDRSSLVIQGALASPEIETELVDAGEHFSLCAGLPFGGTPTTPPAPADVCAGDLPSPFTDVSPASVHAANVDCAARHQLVAGGPNGLPPSAYGPLLTTSRAQLATLVVNLLERQGVALPASPPDAFADDDGSVHETSIDVLAAIGVIGGNGESGDRFHPSRPATRSEMASFLHRSHRAAVGRPLPAGRPFPFKDTGDDPAEADIGALLAAGVVSGKDDDHYDPEATVTREQIATFFVRLLERIATDAR